MSRLDRLVAPWAERDPARMAIEGTDESLTYGELDRLANRFANAFRAGGIRPGERVGIHLPRSGRGVAAMLGALRAGAVYVPLDPSSPPARMGLITRDCALRHVVISPVLFSGLARGPASSRRSSTCSSPPTRLPSRRRAPGPPGPDVLAGSPAPSSRRPAATPTTSPTCSTRRAPPASRRA